MKRLTVFFLIIASARGYSQCPWSFTITNNSGTYTLTCTMPIINLSATHNNTNAVNYLWTGPSFASNVSTASVSLPGNYSLVVTDVVTTCSMMQTFAIAQNTTPPVTSASPSTFSLTCNSGSPTFTGIVTSPTINTQHDWYSPLLPFPGPPISTTNNTITILNSVPPGVYTLVTTDLVNGCTAQQTVQVVSIYATFSYTVFAGGVVNFQSTTAGTNIGTTYTWDFGDGSTGSGAATTHTYTNGGIHNVILTLNNPNCVSFPTQVNVNTIPCNANSNFTLTYSGTPQLWNAYPSYYGNVTNAQWNWGDGQTSNVLFTSHTYSAPGNYNICLSVTVSCAGTSSTCSGNNIYKTVNADQAMVTVSVVAGPAVGLKEIQTASDILISVFPNPFNSTLHIQADGLDERKSSITISTITGQVIHESAFRPEIDLSAMESGIYFLTLHRENFAKTVKIVKE